jgi:transcriptional regulator with XRE-family HTH domain
MSIFAPLFLKDIYCMPDIKKRIRECGFTTQQIAEKLNISQQAVSQAINGNPSLSRLEQIASAIGITVSELVADNPASHIEPQQKCPYCGHDLNIKVE